MKGSWAVIFLCITAVRNGNAKTESGRITPGLRSGLLFQPRGPLTLATGSWTAVIRFREQDVSQQAEAIRHHFEKIDQTLYKLQDNYANASRTTENVRGKQFLDQIIKMWQHERLWMEAELRAAESDIRELRAELRSTRRKRGLINALGEGLKWLFGTATEEDTKALHKQIKEVQVDIGKIHHITKLQTTLIGSLNREQRINTRNLALLAKKTAELE